MGKVHADDFGKSRPKLVPDDLEKDAAIATIETAEEIIVDDEDSSTGKRHTLALTFKETGDKALWLNKTQVEVLIERLGDDTEEWIGQRIPVIKHVASFGSKKFPKVIVAPSEQWDKLMPKSRASAAPRSSRRR